MNDYSILDDNLKASADRDERDATYARLDRNKNNLRSWAAFGSEVEPWVQADLGYQTSVSGIITQGCGHPAYSCWVTSVKVSYFVYSDTGDELFVEDPQTGEPMVRLNNNILVSII